MTAAVVLQQCSAAIAAHPVLSKRKHRLQWQLLLLLRHCGWDDAQRFRACDAPTTVNLLLNFASDGRVPRRLRRNVWLPRVVCVTKGIAFPRDRYLAATGGGRGCGGAVATTRCVDLADAARYLRDRLPDGPAAVVLSVLQTAGVRRVNRFHLLPLHQALETLRVDLGEADGASITAACAGLPPSVLSTLMEARASDRLDPPPHRFQTHTRWIPAAVLDRWPALWNYPHVFGHCLVTEFAEEDVRHLLGLLEVWVRSRGGHRTGEALGRTRNAACLELLRVARIRRWFGSEEALWSRLLPVGITPDSFLDVVARVCAAHNRQGSPRGGYSNTMVEHVNSTEKIIRTFNSLVTHQVLPCATHIPAARGPLQARMLAWEQHDPQRYAAVRSVPLPDRTRAEVTDDLFIRLLAACPDARCRSILLLLGTLGLRSGAVARMALDDVWDGTQRRVHTTCHIVEKGAVRRQVWPGDELRESLRAYILSEHPGGGTRLLFPSPNRARRHVPSRGLVAHLVRRVCRSAGVAPINAHQFRHYVINRLARTNRLEDVSKWIGHRTVSVTFVNYFRPDLNAVCVDRRPEAKTDVDVSDASVRQRAASYQRLVDAVRNGASGADILTMLRGEDPRVLDTPRRTVLPDDGNLFFQ